MNIDSSEESVDPEINAIAVVFGALRGLVPDARRRVLDYVGAKFGVPSAPVSRVATRDDGVEVNSPAPAVPAPTEEPPDADGVNSVAKKWMTRSGLSTDRLSKLFSIGLDDIDLVAEKVPGANKKERMRSVILLKGIASYLASGAARVTHDKIKEACVHYDAYDGGNFAAYLKSFSSEVSGSKESGYSLSPKGITAATELIKTALSGNAIT